VARQDEEARSLGADVLVLAQRERDALDAVRRRALADELIAVRTAEAERLLLDPLVDAAKDDLVASKAFLAGFARS
jgi:hypothetical protein